MPNTVVTSAGLDYITCASDGGTLIAIKYFVPVYDYRYDPEVVSGAAYSAVSDEVEGLSAPVGEIIWNSSADDGYALLENAILSAGTDAGGGIITNHPWENWPGIGVNTYNGTPLSDSYVGDSITMSGANTFVLSNIRSSAGNNDPYIATNDKFFPVTDYYPVTSGGNIRGSWKCRFGKKIGKAKFNKIALYVTAFIDGVQTADPPVFFAEASIDSPIVKTDLAQEGYDDIIMDVQIDIQSVTSAFDSVFFSTSGDYWSRSPDGSLYYPEKIGVGSFEESVENPQATAHLRRTRSTSGITQLRIDEDSDHYTTIETESFNVASNYYTVLTIGLENSASPSLRDFGIIRPDIDGYYYFGGGNPNRRFKAGYFSDFLNIGKATGTGDRIYISSADGITLYNDSDNNLNFVNGDLYRTETELLTYTQASTATSAGKDVWSIAGVVTNYVTGHNNILSAARDLSPKTTDYRNRFNQYTTLNLLARGGVNIHGPLDVDSRNAGIGTVITYDQGLVRSSQNALMLGGGLSGDIGTVLQIDATLNGTANVFDPYLKTNARLDLISRNIYTYGNIIPWSTSAYDIGSQYRIYNNIYASSIGTVAKKIDTIYGQIVYGDYISTSTSRPLLTDIGTYTEGFYERNRSVPNGYWYNLGTASFTGGGGAGSIGYENLNTNNGTITLTTGINAISLTNLAKIFNDFTIYDFKYCYFGKTVIISFGVYIRYREDSASSVIDAVGLSPIGDYEWFHPFNINFTMVPGGTLKSEASSVNTLRFDSQVCSQGSKGTGDTLGPVFLGVANSDADENRLIFRMYGEGLNDSMWRPNPAGPNGQYMQFSLVRELA